MKNRKHFISQESFQVQNELLRIFVEEVRRSGYHNADRVLILNPYAAFRSNLEYFSLSEDSAENRLLAGFHDFTVRANGLLASLDYYQGEGAKYISQYNLVLTEFGLPRTASPEDRVRMMERSVEAYRALDVPMFVWDDGGEYGLMKKDAAAWDEAYGSDQVAEAFLLAYGARSTAQPPDAED